MKKISTKNLYLCELRQVSEKIGSGSMGYDVYFSDDKKYIFAKRSTSGVYVRYIDVFTKSSFFNVGQVTSCEGEWYVKSSYPVITDYKYVSEDILIGALKECNPTFFMVDKNYCSGSNNKHKVLTMDSDNKKKN